MTSASAGTILWRTSNPRPTALRFSQRRTLGVLGRTAGIMAAALAFGLTTVVSTPRADYAAPPDRVLPSGVLRLVPAHAPPLPAGSTAAGPDIFQRAPMTSGARFRLGGMPAMPAGFTPREATQPSDWVEEEFAQVAVVDGRTIAAGERRIRLAGLDLPMAEQVCRTLDGRLEPCAVRASTQLELLTRWRRVTCRYRLDTASEGVGRCRIGTNDLTERMIMTGYAWRSGAAPAGADL